MRVATWLCCGLLTACTATAPSPIAEPSRPPDLTLEEQAIQEAVFRHQFTESGEQMGHSLDFIFLKYEDGSDVPAEFLARFRDCKVPVAPASMSTVIWEDGHIDEVRHREKPGRGRRFWVGKPRRIADDTFEVDGGYYQGRLAASGHVYRVERRDNAWRVVDDVMKWIS